MKFKNHTVLLWQPNLIIPAKKKSLKQIQWVKCHFSEKVGEPLISTLRYSCQRLEFIGLSLNYRICSRWGVSVLNSIDVRGVMFDCYKTLVDIKTDEKSIRTYEPVSRWLMYHGVNIGPQDLMNEYRWRCKEEIERRREMHSEIKVEDIFAKICKHHASWGINEVTVGMEAARIFRSASLRRLQAYPQSFRMLEALKGYPMGIVSNGQRVFSELEVRHLGLQTYFKFILFSSDFGRKKPCPEIFLAGADLLGLSPHEILFIGDSFENDINPSRGLGMKSMHIEEAWRFFKVT